MSLKFITPIGPKIFLSELKSLLLIQVGALSIPIGLYLWAHKVGRVDFILIALSLVIIFQAYLSFMAHKLLNITGRIKDMYPGISDKAAKRGMFFTFIPVTALLFYAHLSRKKATPSEKTPFIFSSPILSSLGIFLFCLGINLAFTIEGPSAPQLNVLRSMTLDPTTYFLSQIRVEVNSIKRVENLKLENKTLDTLLSKDEFKNPTTTANLLLLTSSLAETYKRKNRDVASVGKDLNSSVYMFQVIENTLKILKRQEEARPSLLRNNPIFLVSPAGMVNIALISGLEEAVAYRVNARLIPATEKMFSDMWTEVEKNNGKKSASNKARLKELQAQFQETRAYKSHHLMAQNFILKSMNI